MGLVLLDSVISAKLAATPHTAPGAIAKIRSVKELASPQVMD
jgi:hypothetical protein